MARDDEGDLKDPMSGYASGDTLDPSADTNQPQKPQEELRDPMSGYASGDLLNPRAEANVDQTPSTEPAQDSMSGYASADALGDSQAEKPKPGRS